MRYLLILTVDAFKQFLGALQLQILVIRWRLSRHAFGKLQ